MNNIDIMNIDQTVIKAAEDVLRKMNDYKEKQEKSADEIKRESISKRWREAIEDCSLKYELQLPKKGLVMALDRVDKGPSVILKSVQLSMKLVYDPVFPGQRDGAYASPNVAPNIEIVIILEGEVENKVKHMLAFVSKLIHQHTGLFVTMTEEEVCGPDDICEHGLKIISFECMDNVECWNIADFILEEHDYYHESEHVDEATN